MIFTSIWNIRPVGVMYFFLLPALAGCGSGGGGSMLLEDALSLAAGPGAAVDTVGVEPNQSDANGNTPGSSGGPGLPPDTADPLTQTTPDSNRPTSQANTGLEGDGPGENTLSDDPLSSEVVVDPQTIPGSLRLADLPRDNPDAADLLDHWGHRRGQKILDGLFLTDADAEADAADLHALRTAAQAGDEDLDAPDLVVGDAVLIDSDAVPIAGTGETGSEALVAPNLFDGDEVRILGARRGITYGRWTGGPADTLSIEFDLSHAGPAMRDDPMFRAMLDRSGKVWSRRIADTWSTSEWRADAVKGYSADPDRSIEFRVGEDGETSNGLEIAVTDADLPENEAGRGGYGLYHYPQIFGNPISVRLRLTGTIFWRATRAICSACSSTRSAMCWGHGQVPYLRNAMVLMSTRRPAHGAGPTWLPSMADPRRFRTFPIRTRGSMASGIRSPPSTTSPTAASAPRSWPIVVDQAALTTLRPHALDFAFLADLGLTITDETTRPETYGLAGWTDHAGFTLSVSRDLQVSLADPQPYYDMWINRWRTMDVVDLLQAEANAFGHRSTGDLRLSYPLAGAFGTVRYAGGLLGAALNRAWLPPVLGNANLAVNLGTLDGTASFTSLAVYTNGISEPFAGGTLHYPFALSENSFFGTDTRSTFLADFYGPAHEEVAGTLHDPRAGLLASFGATVDDRPSREDVVVSADHVFGRSYQHGSADPANDGWYHYRCGTDSACELRHAGTSGWTDWTATTRERVLASAAGWNWRETERPEADYGFVRIARQTAASTDGAQGRQAVDGYTGTLEHVAFGVGFEGYSPLWTDENVTPPGSGNVWAGFQGTMSGGLPEGLARWSGPMVGYHQSHPWRETPFVEGRARVGFSLSTNRVDVAFSEVVSRDGQRALPDFGFEDLRLTADGIFVGGGTAGAVDGAFFGPSQEEAAGAFYHNELSMRGSFGARRMPDTVTLEASGTATPIGNVADGSGFYSFDDWGFWGKQFDETVFGAFLAHEISAAPEGGTTYTGPFTRIDGEPTGSNPVSGTAVWSGQVRAADTHADNYLRPVSGTARLEVDFSRCHPRRRLHGF